MPRRPRERRGFSGLALAAGGAAVAVVAAVVVLALLLSGGTNEEPAAGAGPSAHLPVLAEHPLGRRALERVLEERFLPVPDDDEADVTCSARIPEPAHSLRRCRVAYPGGSGREVVVLTNAAGAEVLAEP